MWLWNINFDSSSSISCSWVILAVCSAFRLPEIQNHFNMFKPWNAHNREDLILISIRQSTDLIPIARAQHSASDEGIQPTLRYIGALGRSYRQPQDEFDKIFRTPAFRAHGTTHNRTCQGRPPCALSCMYRPIHERPPWPDAHKLLSCSCLHSSWLESEVFDVKHDACLSLFFKLCFKTISLDLHKFYMQNYMSCPDIATIYYREQLYWCDWSNQLCDSFRGEHSSS